MHNTATATATAATTTTTQALQHKYFIRKTKTIRAGCRTSEVIIVKNNIRQHENQKTVKNVNNTIKKTDHIIMKYKSNKTTSKTNDIVRVKKPKLFEKIKPTTS